MTNDNINVAMVGLGQWGGIVLRNLAATRGCRVAAICDIDETVLDAHAARYPDARPERDYQSILDDPGIDAVAIATPADGHFDMARRALEAGKHVFVEKPMTLRSADAEELVRLAERVGRRLMVGHLLEHHPAFDELRRMVRDGTLGDIIYIYAQRLNLGVVRRHENAWWSLAAHDVSVICRLFDAPSRSVAAVGQCYLQRDKGIHDVVFATLTFDGGRIGHVHVSWLDPHKTRQMTVVGTRQMAVWDDMSASEKIRLYDKGADPPHAASYPEAITLRTGDIRIPRISGEEPMARQMRHFVDCILHDRPVLTDGTDGLRVVRVLEAGQRSLEGGGAAVAL